MANILIIGSFKPSESKCHELLEYLAKEIADQGHHLLNGCRNEIDEIMARCVYERLMEKGIDTSKRITCYVSPNTKPVHEFGTILKSRCLNWESLASTGLDIPETITLADVVIVIGGAEGTMCAANWSRIARKPLLPLTNFGGSAAEIFEEELKDFETIYSDRIDKSEYEILNQISSDMAKIARETISLAARTIISRNVFVIMSFSEDPKLCDAYESFETICKEYEYECERVNNVSIIDRIVPEIFHKIKKAAFVIVDLSEIKPNVYYELGFAQGLCKQVIITAYKNTPLPFDVADIPTIFWEGQKQLKERLREKLAIIASAQGR
jgi:predicted Rossmann-fold nucleotide-binding protein